ncbi:MAG: hypothetical protein AAB909_01780 [Patescibacteria group bacterium]
MGIKKDWVNRATELGSAMGGALGVIKLGEILGQPVCIGTMGLLVGGVLFLFVRKINKENSKV